MRMVIPRRGLPGLDRHGDPDGIIPCGVPTDDGCCEPRRAHPPSGGGPETLRGAAGRPSDFREFPATYGLRIGVGKIDGKRAGNPRRGGACPGERRPKVPKSERPGGSARDRSYLYPLSNLVKRLLRDKACVHKITRSNREGNWTNLPHHNRTDEPPLPA